MKLVIEPLGVNDEKLLSMAKDMLPADLEIVYYNTRVTDTETLIERGHDADIIAVSNLPMNADVINGCKNLKMLSVAFTGVDHIAMDACKANGVLVSNCAGYSTAAVADLVFGMIIALYRNMIPCNDVVRKEGTKDGLVGFELEGKKFGVIGTGAIGLLPDRCHRKRLRLPGPGVQPHEKGDPRGHLCGYGYAPLLPVISFPPSSHSFKF